MIGGCEHDHPNVLLEAVELVQEEGSILRIDQRVEIFEHQHARTKLPGALEDTFKIRLFGLVTRLDALERRTRTPRDEGFRRPSSARPESEPGSMSRWGRDTIGTGRAERGLNRHPRSISREAYSFLSPAIRARVSLPVSLSMSERPRRFSKFAPPPPFPPPPEMSTSGISLMWFDAICSTILS